MRLSLRRIIGISLILESIIWIRDMTLIVIEDEMKKIEYFLDFMMPNIQEKVPEILED